MQKDINAKTGDYTVFSGREKKSNWLNFALLFDAYFEKQQQEYREVLFTIY